jgi:hypothetical protein
MASKVLKLYRGLSSEDLYFATNEVLKQNKRTWSSILYYRVNGNFKYPEQLDRSIIDLHKNSRLEYQYFTDSKIIAEGYARKIGGILVELSVPFNDVLKHFDIEFQNFGRRKKQFEIVYCVKGTTIAKYDKQWRLKVQKKK